MMDSPQKDGSKPRSPSDGSASDSNGRPSLEEVSARLDRLWSEQPAPALPSLIGSRLGKYEIRQVVGHGSFGVVYRARDTELDRDVALKMPRPEVLVDSEKLGRFQREALTAAVFDHPLIVPVYEANLERPAPYIVSAFCSGPNLGQWLSGRKSPVPARQAAAFVAKLAGAVQHAHDQGVLHRDLKPSNILLESSESEVVGDNLIDYEPRLADFGLAKLLDPDQQDTRISLLIGTPHYMAPEQLSNDATRVSPATDVYALGVLLFELNTLRTPFAGSNYVELLDKLRTCETTHLRKFNSSTPRDLQTICAKCLEIRPKDRYASAADLADDLQRYLANQSVVARRPSIVDRARKWLMRHPAAVWTMMATMLVVSVALAISQAFIGAANRDLSDALAREGAATATAQAAERRAGDLLYAADVRLAGEALANNNVTEARERLARHLPQSGKTDRRGFAWHYLWGQLHQEEVSLTGHGPAHDVEYSPDGSLLASSHASGKVVLYQADTGEQLHVLEGARSTVRKIEFSPDGKLLAVACDDGRVVVWHTADGSEWISFSPHQEEVDDVAFHPSGEQLATAGDGMVKLYQLPELGAPAGTDFVLTPVEIIRALPGIVYAVDVSSDGRWLMAAGDVDAPRKMHGYVIFWDLDKHELVKTFYLSHKVYSAGFSNSARLIAAGTQSGEVAVWDVETHEQLASWKLHTSNVYDLCFSADERFIITASKDTTVRVWDVGERQLQRVVQGHAQRVYGAAFSSASEQIATASRDGTVKIWRPMVNSFSQRVLSPGGRSSGLSINAPSAAVTSRGGLAVWHDLASSTRHIIPALLQGGGQVAWQQDGPRCVLSGEVDQWPELHSASDEPASIVSTDLDGDGDEDRVAATGRPGRVVWQDNRGSGKFGKPRLFGVLTIQKYRSVVAEFDREEGLDLLSISQKHGRLQLNSHGHHQRDNVLIPFSGLDVPADLVVADLDEDGDLDAVVPTHGDDSVCWLEQDGMSPDGTPRFAERHVLTDQLGGAADVLVADFTGDSLPDVVAAGFDDARVLLFKNLGDRQFDEGQPLPGDVSGPKVLDVVDVDADGQLDVVAATAREIVWYRNRGGGQFLSAASIDSLDSADWIRPLPRTVVVYNAQKHEVEHRLTAYTNASYRTAISPDGSHLAVVGSRHYIRILQLPNEQLLVTIPRAEARIEDLAYTPDGRYLLAAAGDDLRIWDTRDYRLLHVLEQHDNTINRIAVSDDGRLVATTSDDMTVRIWSLPKGLEQRVLTRHESRPYPVAFSRDGRRLATGAEDGTVRIWDVVTGQELLALRQTTGSKNGVIEVVQALAFQDERTLLATVWGDTTKAIMIAQWRAE